jgi:hypothetical protein
VTAEDAERTVIRPMCRLYKPPRHLQASEDTAEEALKEYRRALAPFDADILEQAWRQVVRRHGFWCWPGVADIVVAAEQARRDVHPAGQPQAWFDRAEALTDAYVRKFMKASAHAARAREGSYERELKRYVQAAAWPQAQVIAGRTDGQSYESAVLFQDGEDAGQRDAWFERARKQAETGQIRVTVPPALVTRWAGEAEAKGRDR